MDMLGSCCVGVSSAKGICVGWKTMMGQSIQGISFWVPSCSVCGKVSGTRVKEPGGGEMSGGGQGGVRLCVIC